MSDSPQSLGRSFWLVRSKNVTGRTGKAGSFFTLVALVLALLVACAGKDPVVTAQKAKNLQQATQALNIIDDQGKLSQVALFAQNQQVATAALARINKQDILANVVRISQNPTITTQAINQLSDSATLKRMLSVVSSDSLKSLILEKITDDSLLVEITLAQYPAPVAQKAFKRLQAPAAFVELAKRAKYPSLQEEAFAKLSDLNSLLELGADPRPSVHEPALAKLSDTYGHFGKLTQENKIRAGRVLLLTLSQSARKRWGNLKTVVKFNYPQSELGYVGQSKLVKEEIQVKITTAQGRLLLDSTYKAKQSKIGVTNKAKIDLKEIEYSLKV